MSGIRTILRSSRLAATVLTCSSACFAGTPPLLSPPSPLMPGQSKLSTGYVKDMPALIFQAKVTSIDCEVSQDGPRVHSLVKATVCAFRQGDDQNKIDYEQFWFHDGQAVEMDKPRNVEFPAGSSVSIRVAQYTLSRQQTKAAANVVMRLVLDTLLHKREVAGVTVPADAFTAISQELQYRKGHVLPEGKDPPKNAHVIFKLIGDASDLKQTFYWI